MKQAICCGFAVALGTGCGPTGSQRSQVPIPDDQISIGYGTQNKRDATSAITSVSPTEADARVTRIEDLLQARVPGLEVLPLSNGMYTLRIRGRHSITGRSGDDEPLLVIDDIPVSQGSLGSVRAGTYEIQGGDDRAAWVVAEPDGSGMVLAALSPDPLKFDEFVRAAAWDSAALVPTWSGADAAGSMSDIVQRMLGDGYFNYDVVTYSVAPPVYAQQDLTPQQTPPGYDAYPECLNCTFIGEQLIIYEPVFVARRRLHRERVRETREPERVLALSLGPPSMVAPQTVSRGSRFAAPHPAAGPVPIEPRARAEVVASPPRTPVRYPRFSDPAPDRSMVAIALPAGAAPALTARVSPAA